MLIISFHVFYFHHLFDFIQFVCVNDWESGKICEESANGLIKLKLKSTKARTCERMGQQNVVEITLKSVITEKWNDAECDV